MALGSNHGKNGIGVSGVWGFVFRDKLLSYSSQKLCASLVGSVLCRQPLSIAHCSKIAVSHVCRGAEIFCVQPGASTQASWGTLGRSWAIGEHKIFIAFWWFLGWVPWTKHVYLFMLVSRFLFLMIPGFVWDWKIKHLAGEVPQKATLAELGILMIPVSIFMIFGSLGTNFHNFCCPGDWLEI